MSRRLSGNLSATLDPHPRELGPFLLWACGQLRVGCCPEDPDVLRVVVNEVRTEPQLARVRVKIKPTTKKATETSAISVTSEVTFSTETKYDSEGIDGDPLAVRVQALYDVEGNLTTINIMNNKYVPRRIIRILQLIIDYHPYLESLTINRGIDQYTICEISKLLSLSNITELCLDNTVFEQANYYILLENINNLTYLSLCRCRLNDIIVQIIAERLESPRPASNTLSILYLSMNRITDAGATALARALRSNRKLSYINLAGNMITDDGVNELLSVLYEYPLTRDEILSSEANHVEYVKNKLEMINKLKHDESPRRLHRKRTPTKHLFERALKMANVVYGDQIAETFVVDVVHKNDLTYCNGNNSLAYINFAYNNLSACSLKTIIKVLHHQNNLNRTPKGLVNVNIEGNPFDKSAAVYLMTIDHIIRSHLSSESKSRKASNIK